MVALPQMFLRSQRVRLMLLRILVRLLPVSEMPIAVAFYPRCCSAGYQVVTDGHLGSVGGTSASTPAFAGMISLINEALLQQGGKPLGFLNPFLYQNEAKGFTDITVGACAQSCSDAIINAPSC